MRGLYDPEDGGGMFFRNSDALSMDYKPVVSEE
jgi:hypothetical protein